jgi:hypothetical protein
LWLAVDWLAVGLWVGRRRDVLVAAAVVALLVVAIATT